MKIEMGESLLYSWLRHVKECQLVQTNWKASPQWTLSHNEELDGIMQLLDEHYSKKYDYAIFKKNKSLYQLLQQGECDVLGISAQQDEEKYYAIDVAFHKGGLNYTGGSDVTVMKVLEKCARTAFCLYGYFSTKKAEIIFASPLIKPIVMNKLKPCLDDLNKIFEREGFTFRFRIIGNNDFKESVMDPLLLVSGGVADTSELFLRSYQMLDMFKGQNKKRKTGSLSKKEKEIQHTIDFFNPEVYKELKIGQIAQKILGPMLCEGCASPEEIEDMQTKEYSRDHFGLQYPVLKADEGEKTPTHYYATPLIIDGKSYRLCCEWFEKEGANNDRPYLIKWIEEHYRE